MRDLRRSMHRQRAARRPQFRCMQKRKAEQQAQVRVETQTVEGRELEMVAITDDIDCSEECSSRSSDCSTEKTCAAIRAQGFRGKKCCNFF